MISWNAYKTKKYPRDKLKDHDGNFALICGPSSAPKGCKALAIFDIDLKFNDKKYLNEVLTEFKATYPELADTYIAETPHGFHFMYNLIDFNPDKRSYNKNLISDKRTDKKTGETTEIFKGITKTRMEQFMKGCDILALGYALIAPSWLIEVKFIDQNDNEQIKYDYEIKPGEIKKELRREKVSYTLFSPKPIKKITKEEYEKITSFFVRDTPNTMRKPFIDIVNGLIEIEDQSVKTGQKEFLYWKALFQEAYNYCGIHPHELFPFLLKNQSHFDQNETLTQLAYPYHDFHNKPLTNDTMKDFFPEYYKIKKIDLNRISTQTEKKTEKDNEPETIQTIYNFNGFDIWVRTDGIWKIEWHYPKNTDKEPYYIPTLILDGQLDIDRMTTDEQMNNEDLFVVNFKDKHIHTKRIKDILKILDDSLYCGSIGRDFIKKVFNYNGDILRKTKDSPRYILGFSDGWNLPQLEEKYKYLLVLYTDYQYQSYKRTKNLLDEKLSDKKKIEIRNTLIEFLNKTQMKPVKLMLNIAWSIAAPFRIPIIKFLNIFPLLINHGDPGSGKSYIEDFFIVNFYKVLEKHISPNILESPSRFEDQISQSSLPISIQEIYECRDRSIVPLLKDHATGISDFERKKDARSLDFKKPKTAAVNLDCNKLPPQFNTPALNTRSIFIDYGESDKVIRDPEWIDLFIKLSKESLFSFIYEYTQDWDNEFIDNKFREIYNFIKEETGINISETEKEYPRLLAIYQIMIFGIELFQKAFDIDLRKLFNEKYPNNPIEIDVELYNFLLKARKGMTLDIRDQFYYYCNQAVYFDPENKEIKYPAYLSVKMENYNPDYYLFTQDNLHDFNKYTSQNYTLKELKDLLYDSIEDKNLIKDARPRVNNSRPYVILVSKMFV